MTVDAQEFQRQARTISRKLAAIGGATLSRIDLDTFTLNNRLAKPIIYRNQHKNRAYCQFTKPCPDKRVHHAQGGQGNSYRVCWFDGGCNQQTHERVLGKATP